MIAAFPKASVPDYEDLTDVNIIATRLRFGADRWELPGPFFDFPGVPPHDRWVLRNKPGYLPSPLKDGTLGYTIAAQAPSGVIHILTCRNYPAQHFDLNEAWILDTGAGKPADAPAPLPDATVRTQRENHADGTSVSTPFRPDGSKRRQSTWRGLRCHGPARAWDAAGGVIAEHEFRHGVMVK